MALLEDIKEQWKEDSRMNPLKLSDEVFKIPLLHHKYLDILSATQVKYKRAEVEFAKMKRMRFRYYRGELTREELTENEWKQWQGVKPIKSEMEEYLNSDDILLPLSEKVEYLNICIKTLEMIMKDIFQRSYSIKTIQDIRRFEAGG